jgi:KUP system potassium uptake protein
MDNYYHLLIEIPALSLILNYMGQGTFLLNHVTAITTPFYMIAPAWFKIPLIFIATIATVIAFQSSISATFFLTKQAIVRNMLKELMSNG